MGGLRDAELKILGESELDGALGSNGLSTELAIPCELGSRDIKAVDLFETNFGADVFEGGGVDSVLDDVEGEVAECLGNE